MGPSLIVVTIAIHTTGVVMMAFGDARLRGRTEKRHPGPLRAILTVSSHIAVIALLLVALHALEAAL